MNNKIIRTNQTELSDDELIIFDLLFDSYQSVNSLKKGDNVTIGLNYPISHQIETTELISVVETFVDMGLMKFKLGFIPEQNQIYPRVGLTEKGGNLWEKERLPDWEKYVADSSSDENGFWELSISSPSLKTAKHFMLVVQECKLYELSDPRKFEILENQVKETEPLIPWKTFGTVYEIKSRLSERMGSGNRPLTDWKLYQKKARCWRTVKELQISKQHITSQ